MARSSGNILISGIAGAIGGVVVTLILLNNPALLTPLTGNNQPLSTRQAPSTGALVESEEATVQAVEQANPAVVSIVITKDVPVIEQYFEQAPGFPSNPLGDLFGDGLFGPFSSQIPRLRQEGTQQREVGGGSGFIVSPDGLIITNRHVVSQEGAEYTVFLNDGAKYSATVRARDPVNDIAILKIEGSNLPFLEWGDSDQLKVGQTVIAIGNALGEFRNTVSVGVVSGLARSITASDQAGQVEQLEEVIQTDAAINPGNSGGPLLNLDGQVVGVNVAVALGSENIGFALPANLVKSVVESVEETGRIVRPYLGVRYVPVTPVLRENNNLPVDYGVLIVRGDSAEDLPVLPGSPADKADLKEGDIILEIDGIKLDQEQSLAAIIRRKNVGDTVRLKVLSSSQEREVSVTLEEIPQ